MALLMPQLNMRAQPIIMLHFILLIKLEMMNLCLENMRFQIKKIYESSVNDLLIFNKFVIDQYLYSIGIEGCS